MTSIQSCERSARCPLLCVFPTDGVTAVLEVKEVTDHKMTGDFTFLDSKDVVVARLTGYEAVMDATLFKAFTNKSIKIQTGSQDKKDIFAFPASGSQSLRLGEKKGKKHNPSSREGVQHCTNNTVKQEKKHLLLVFGLFFRGSGIVFSRLHLEGVKKNQVNPVNPVRKRVGFMYK